MLLFSSCLSSLNDVLSREPCLAPINATVTMVAALGYLQQPPNFKKNFILSPYQPQAQIVCLALLGDMGLDSQTPRAQQANSMRREAYPRPVRSPESEKRWRFRPCVFMLLIPGWRPLPQLGVLFGLPHLPKPWNTDQALQGSTGCPTYFEILTQTIYVHAPTRWRTTQLLLFGPTATLGTTLYESVPGLKHGGWLGV